MIPSRRRGQVGEVHKEATKGTSFMSIFKEATTDADKFTISFPQDLKVKIKCNSTGLNPLGCTAGHTGRFPSKPFRMPARDERYCCSEVVMETFRMSVPGMLLHNTNHRRIEVKVQ